MTFSCQSCPRSSNHQIISKSITCQHWIRFFCFHSIPLGNGKNLGFRQNALRPNKNTLNAPRIHVHQILIPFNCRTHLYWANRSIHHLFWTATPYFAWLKPSNRHSPTHYSCYHYYHSYRHYCFTAIIFSPLLLLLLLGYHTYS